MLFYTKKVLKTRYIALLTSQKVQNINLGVETSQNT